MLIKPKKIIRISILTIFIVLLSVSSQVANAQSLGGGSGYGAGSGVGFGNSGDIQGTIKDLIPAIAKLPGCKSKLGSAGASFSSISGAGSGNLTDKGTDKAKSSLNTTETSALGETTAIETYLTPSQGKILSDIYVATAGTKKSTTDTNTNETCLNSIGKMVVKVMVQKITVSTVNWINNGFEGNPTFVTNIQNSIDNINAKNILSIGTELNNSSLYPFAKNFLKNEANVYKSYFASNAAYTLNKVENPTKEKSFTQDFGNGGWAAWDVMTQIPANNPFAFQLLASNELEQRNQDEAQALTNDLNRGNGFMSQKTCANPIGVTQEENAKFLNGEFKNPDGSPDESHHCIEWKNVTPGSLIADAAVNTQNYPKDSLLTASTLNDAIAAIADALANQLTTKIQTGVDGYLGLSDQSQANSNPYSDGIDQYASLTTPTQTEQDFPNSVSSSWLQNNPDFNIRTDLNQALIDEQRTYIQKLQAENNELLSTVPTNGIADFTGNYGLIPIIDQLDYCIPGPHPGWEADAKAQFEAMKNNIIDITGMDFLQISQATGQYVSLNGGGSSGSSGSTLSAVYSIVNTLTMQGMATPSNTDALRQATYGRTQSKETACQYLGPKVESILGVTVASPSDHNNHFDDSVCTNSAVTDILDEAFSKYEDVVDNQIFTIDQLPLATGEAKVEFNKLPGYRRMLSNNTTKISTQKSIVIRLATIKNAVDNLNYKLQHNSFTIIAPNVTQQNEYESELKPWINSFGRLSQDLVDGSDIANADIILKQIKDKEQYLYNDLLKGPQGCENDPGQFTNAANPHLQDYINQMKRYPFQGPILYSYRDAAHSAIPDPFGMSVFGNSTPIHNTTQYTNSGTPGLNFVRMNDKTDGPDGSEPGKINIHVSDLVNLDYSQAATGFTVQTFEKNLSIY